jgi:hypothetical protein
MKETNDIEKNIESLERELRAMGEPYSKDMPSDAYFADFQSRLMNRIASEQVAVAPKKSVSPVSSPMRITALVGVIVLVVAGFFYFGQPKNMSKAPIEKAPIVTEAPKAIDNETAYDINVKQTKPEVKQDRQSMQDTNLPKVTEAPKPPVVKPNADIKAPAPQNAASNFEGMDELSVSDPESPVTYDKLSVGELESVLKILETNDFESERDTK